MLRTNQVIHILHWPQIDLGPRQESPEANIYRKPPFDPGGNFTFDGPVLFVNLFNLIP